jgi:hypothetical protein
MKTLYDLLGALPDDDAEGLRTAFRKAAKATHPDVNAADPDAPLRFRQVMRANAILSDAQQRAAYDKLMVITAQERVTAAAAAAAATVRPQRRPAPAPAPAPVRSAVRKVVFEAIAVASLSTLSIGGYLVFDRLSHASADQSGKLEVAARPTGSNAGVAPVRPFDTARRDELTDMPTGAGATETPAVSKPEPAAADLTTGSGPAANVSLKGAKSVRRAFADINNKARRVRPANRTVKRTRTAASSLHMGWSSSASTWSRD